MGTQDKIIKPIKSARIRTINSFNFKFGKVEVRAKLPTGDWLWPAIWFLSKDNKYGTWPASGEIDLVESRGNINLKLNGKIIGVKKMSSTLHFGPYWPLNGYETATFSRELENGFNSDFHKYQMEWNTEHIKFSVDDIELGVVAVGDGFWKRAGFDENKNLKNIWQNGTLMAPFDQEFHLIINLAVGGTNFFPDNAENAGGNKPWKNSSPNPEKEFWDNKEQWLPTWNMNNDEKSSALQVDYIKIWSE